MGFRPSVPGSVVGVVLLNPIPSPRQVGRIVELTWDTKLLSPASLFQDNVKACFERNLPRFVDEFELGMDRPPAIIIAGGPSLKTDLSKIKYHVVGDRFGCGTNHDYLIENGITPRYHVICDPGDETVDFIKKPHKDIIYLLSSCCSPKTFDALEGYRVYVWHSHFTLEDKEIMLCDYHGEPSIKTGPSVTLAAFPISWLMGYRKYHFFGFDCSFPENNIDQHAYKYDYIKEEPVIVHMGNKKYYTTPGFMIQLRTFITYIGLSKGIEVSVYGDSLVSAVCQWRPE